MKKISIITINYNNVSELGKTLDSVFKQSFQDFEYIVIDGGSTDGGKTLIEQHTNKIDYWISEADNGVYDAMNKGIVKATGDYLYFLNSGDTFYNNTVLEEINQIVKQQQPDIIFGNVNDIFEEQNTSKIRPKIQLDKIALFHKMVCHQALFCHKRLFKDNLFNTKYKIKADFDWLLNAFTTYHPMVLDIDLIIANYLMGGLSEIQYDTYSRKEIPVIRNTYFSAQEQKVLRRFVFNHKINALPFGDTLTSLFKKRLQSKYQNLR